MKREVLRFWLIAVLVLIVTQPGAIGVANWDALYCFYMDLGA
ncbi:hypothetical protein [Thermococcus piezophilus]|nr:hypothetical protein [Thermococcus piezophilus]